jgi:hypothetical protein
VLFGTARSFGKVLVCWLTQRFNAACVALLATMRARPGAGLVAHCSSWLHGRPNDCAKIYVSALGAYQSRATLRGSG